MFVWIDTSAVSKVDVFSFQHIAWRGEHDLFSSCSTLSVLFLIFTKDFLSQRWLGETDTFSSRFLVLLPILMGQMLSYYNTNLHMTDAVLQALTESRYLLAGQQLRCLSRSNRWAERKWSTGKTADWSNWISTKGKSHYQGPPLRHFLLFSLIISLP